MNHTPQSKFSLSVRSNYDRLSSFYDLISGGTERKFIHEAIGTLNTAGLGNCLDIGCGTGTGLIELSKKHPSAENIVGIDISMGMCKKTLQKLNKKKLTPPPDVCQADAFSLPFLSNSFDLVFMSFTFEIIPQQFNQVFCNEVLRVLKPAGVFSSVNMMESDCRNPIFALYKWGHAHFPSLIDCRPIDSAAILGSFGFKIISTHTYNLWGIPVASVSASKAED